MLATPIPMATFPTTPTPWSPRRLRRPLMLSLLLMPMLRPILGSPTHTTAMATDSTGHTDMDTVASMVDIPMDTGPTDIPTTDKDIAARFLYGYLPRYYPNVFREQISKY